MSARRAAPMTQTSSRAANGRYGNVRLGPTTPRCLGLWPLGLLSCSWLCGGHRLNERTEIVERGGPFPIVDRITGAWRYRWASE